MAQGGYYAIGGVRVLRRHISRAEMGSISRGFLLGGWFYNSSTQAHQLSGSMFRQANGDLCGMRGHRAY